MLPHAALPPESLTRQWAFGKSGIGGIVLNAVDYGSRKLGIAILRQRLPTEPAVIMFLDSIDLFPKKIPSFEYLCFKYGMKPLKQVDDGNTVPDCLDLRLQDLRIQDEDIRNKIDNEWKLDFEKFDAEETELIKVQAKERQNEKAARRKQKKMAAVATDGKDVSSDNGDIICTEDEEAEDEKRREPRPPLEARRSTFMLCRLGFGVTSRRKSQLSDEELPGEEPPGMDEKTMKMRSLVQVYYDFWSKCIGLHHVDDVENQEVHLSIKGALEQMILGALLHSESFKYMPSGSLLRNIKPKKKLKVYPLAPNELGRLRVDGKLFPKYWKPFIESSTSRSGLYIAQSVMDPEKRKVYLKSFEDARDAFREKLISGSAAWQERKRAKLAAAEEAEKHNTTVDDANMQIDFDDIEDVDEWLWRSASSPPPSKKHAGVGLSAIPVADSNNSSKKNKAAKKQPKNGDASKPANKKKPVFGNGGMRRSNWFSSGDKNVERERMVNKLDAVRRVDIIFQNHRDEILGERWKAWYTLGFTQEEWRDMADALLTAIHGLHTIWNPKEPKKDKPPKGAKNDNARGALVDKKTRKGKSQAPAGTASAVKGKKRQHFQIGRNGFVQARDDDSDEQSNTATTAALDEIEDFDEEDDGWLFQPAFSRPIPATTNTQAISKHIPQVVQKTPPSRKPPASSPVGQKSVVQSSERPEFLFIDD